MCKFGALNDAYTLMRAFPDLMTRFVSNTWRHAAARVAVVACASLAVLGCDDGELQHLSSYANLEERIAKCDTAGLEQVLTKLRASGAFGRASAQIDADALSASYSYLKGDYSSAASFADKVVAGVAARDDSASHESLRLMAEMCWVKAEALRRARLKLESWRSAEQGRGYASRAAATAELVGLGLVKSELKRDDRDYQGCLTELRRAEITIDTASIFTSCPDEVVGSLAHAAGIAIDVCHIGAATRLLTKASEFSDKASDKERIDYLCQLVRLHVMMGEVGKASSALGRMEMIVGKSGVRSAEREIDAYQSLVRGRMGDYEWAESRLRKLRPSNSDDEPSLVSLMAYAEVLCGEGHVAEARAVLEDSLRLDETAKPYLWVLYNDSWLAVWQREADYQKAFGIQTQERRRLISSYNNLFAYDDYRRYVELTSALDDRRRADVQAVSASCNIRLAIATLLLLAAAGVVVFFWRKNLGRKRISSMRSLSELERHDYDAQISELRKQADMLEDTNDRISESLDYAEHIQRAISPSPDGLNAFPISGSFVFYSPLDVVSGDFFWYTRRGNTLIVCCADCTGHGVPGALLSMISATILNNICTNLDGSDIDPGVILEKLDNSLIENLAHNTEQKTKDGLDCALVAIDLATHVVKMSAARRPIVVVRDGALSTIRGTKRSIGDLEPIVRQRSFSTTTIEMRKGDKIYMYTDGYNDQFGGQNGEKLKNSMVERFISQICGDDMDQQSLAIQEMFVQWKGDFPQTDDVTFVGLSV